MRQAGFIPDPGTVDDIQARDEGKYLRVKVLYSDRNGAGKMAIGVSDNPVRAEVTSDSDIGVENPENGSPGFTQGSDYTRSVPESTAKGMPVGAPVVARDPNDDTLTYDLDVGQYRGLRRHSWFRAVRWRSERTPSS